MKKKTYKILIVIIFLAGLSLLLYPFVANQWNNHRQKQLISSYEDNLTELTEAGDIDYAKELKKAQAYNDALLPSILPDSFAVADARKEEDSTYMNCLNLTGDGMMGIVEIPKIAIKLPIYHGTEEKVLQSGVGHFEGTSLPIGGESTHAVLTGHRGLPSKLLFTDLDNLEKGDIFYIKVLGETFAYQVDQILTVLPENTKELTIVPGKDYVTLVTCTPYAVNTHRLLVRGYRIPYEEAVEKVPDEKIAIGLPFQMKVLFIGLFILFLILFFCGVAAYVKKRKKKREKTRREDHVSNEK